MSPQVPDHIYATFIAFASLCEERPEMLPEDASSLAQAFTNKWKPWINAKGADEAVAAAIIRCVRASLEEPK